MNRVVNVVLLVIRSIYSSFRVKHVAFGFDLIVPIESLTVIPFSCREKNLQRI